MKGSGEKSGTLKQYASDLDQFLSWLDASETQIFHALQTTDIHNYAKHLESKLFHHSFARGEYHTAT
ncbi:site-specific integrase [Pseudobacillus badius]|uniref:site-specific integrase n=1 Tax=Bacillus badius TaxID=1455 RepID=UPI001CBD9E1A|nr:site-specific integrase [Bacillus badius]GLY11905.1 hypothetical protein Bbad01_31210 [Bacillus badius]